LLSRVRADHQKVPASKPEAQAEGNHVILLPGNAFPRLAPFDVAQITKKYLLRSPKRKLREITLFAPRKRIPSARASGFPEFASAAAAERPGLVRVSV
jgi:hypothetical protein